MLERWLQLLLNTFGKSCSKIPTKVFSWAAWSSASNFVYFKEPVVDKPKSFIATTPFLVQAHV